MTEKPAAEKPTLQGLQAEVTALRLWMMTLFALQAGQDQKLMAEWIRRRVAQFKTWSASEAGFADTASVSDYSRLLGQLERTGELIARDLETASADMIAELQELKAVFGPGS
jgi:hypothetical protein